MSLADVFHEPSAARKHLHREGIDRACTQLRRSAPVVTKPVPPTLTQWCLDENLLIEGRPLDLANRPWLRGVYDDVSPHIVLIKATQVGGSVWAVFRCIYLAKALPNWRGWGYFFPTKTDVSDFSQARVKPMLDQNPSLRGVVGSDEDSGGIDSVGIRQIGSGFIYFRGMKSKVGTKSFPADGIVLDELDEATEKAKKMVMERMAGSEYNYVAELSNPTLPNYGIDLAYSGSADGKQLGSDQRVWMLKCTACNQHQCLEAEFPTELGKEDLRVLRPRDPTAEDANQFLPGTWYRCCVKCQAELDIRAGEWVAAKPHIRSPHGYRLSQLYSPTVDPAAIAKEYFTTRYPDVFYNLKIGIGWVYAADRLQVSDVTKWCGNLPMRSSDPGPCSMGVDHGGSFHVIISRPSPFVERQIVHIGEYPNRVEADWSILDQLMERYHVGRCVIDANPGAHSPRSFALRHKGRVFLNYYGNDVRGRPLWNEDDFTVREDRTELLDASRALFRPPPGIIRVVLPRHNEIIDGFAQHVCALVKKREESDAGAVKYAYVHAAGTPDHWAHAWAYDVLCWFEDVSPARPIARASYAALKAGEARGRE